MQMCSHRLFRPIGNAWKVTQSQTSLSSFIDVSYRRFCSHEHKEIKVKKVINTITRKCSFQFYDSFAEYFTISYSRSSGPGGQNVNKVNTKVLLRFKVADASWLSEELKKDLTEKEYTKINKDGELLIASDRYRTQQSNIDDALMKMQHIIDGVNQPVVEPSLDKQEKIKLQMENAKEMRIMKKRVQSFKKKERNNDL